MNGQICATAWCRSEKNGMVIFTDDNHLTASFSTSLADAFGARFEDAMRQLREQSAPGK